MGKRNHNTFTNAIAKHFSSTDGCKVYGAVWYLAVWWGPNCLAVAAVTRGLQREAETKKESMKQEKTAVAKCKNEGSRVGSVPDLACGVMGEVHLGTVET